MPTRCWMDTVKRWRSAGPCPCPDPSYVKKGSKILPFTASDMPVPESETEEHQHDIIDGKFLSATVPPYRPPKPGMRAKIRSDAIMMRPALPSIAIARIHKTDCFMITFVEFATDPPSPAEMRERGIDFQLKPVRPSLFQSPDTIGPGFGNIDTLGPARLLAAGEASSFFDPKLPLLPPGRLIFC